MGTLSLGPGACFAESHSVSTEESWSLDVLGDIHYDRLEHHDMAWDKREKAHSVRQIENYSKITEDNYPLLLQSLKRGLANDPTSRGVLQVGDLVQALCGSEAIASFTELNFEKPIWVTKGNHDITGLGAREAYLEIVVPFCGDQGDDSNPSQYTHEQNRWLIVIYDGYAKGSLDWLGNIFTGRNPGRVLFVVHQSVVPYNARSCWGVYGRDLQREKRGRLINLLGRFRALVLSGHLHKHSFVERETDHDRSLSCPSAVLLTVWKGGRKISSPV
jgi:hypothetical protein